MNRRARLVIVTGLGLIGLFVGWRLFISHNYLTVELGSDADRYTLVDAVGTEVIASSEGKRLNVKTGDYVATYFRAGQIFSIRPIHVKAITPATVNPGNGSSSAATGKPLLRNAALMITPLGKGYVYFNPISRGLTYADTTGQRDLSGNVSLTTELTPHQATIIAILPLKDGSVAAITTKRIFRIDTSLKTIGLNDSLSNRSFTAATYDAATNRIFTVGVGSGVIFAYRFDKPGDGLKEFYKGEKLANRLSAGGGKLVSYYDSIPSNAAGVVDVYAKRRQVEPLIIDIASGKVTDTLTGQGAVNYASLSPDGQYLALKQKYAATMIIRQLSDQSDVRIPAFTSAVTWYGKRLLLARGTIVLAYDTAKPDDGVSGFAGMNAPIVSFGNDQTKLLMTDNANYTVAVTSGNTSVQEITAPPIVPANGAQFVNENVEDYEGYQ